MIFPRPVLVAAVLLFVCRASHGAERSFQHDFDPASSQSLTLSTYRGSVTVEAADRPGVRVEALVEAQGKDDKELDRRLDEVEITFSQDGPSLVVKGALRNHSKVRFDWGDDDRVDIAYRVIVPRRTGAPLLLVGGEFTAAWRLRSWDRFYLPVPFSRVKMRCEVIENDRLADRDAAAALIQTRLRAINPDRTER